MNKIVSTDIIYYEIFTLLYLYIFGNNKYIYSESFKNKNGNVFYSFYFLFLTN